MHRLLVFLIPFLFGCNPGDTNKEPVPNQLAGQNSPYLLQHQFNPVDWYPWGKTSLEKAKAENKMLIVSIGYSACHWCHVMEEESFSDTAIARLMNRSFVSIKVDREERPDVDNFYMDACLLARQGSCGWPLNVIALPDGKPVWTGTYYPPERWKSLLEYFEETWQNEAQNMEGFAAKMMEALEEKNRAAPSKKKPLFSDVQVRNKMKEYLKSLDPVYGGRKGAPKFPLPHTHELLMEWAFLEKDTLALRQLKKGLDAMGKGGIFDQLGGGFSRYAVDAAWNIPHFEKMLYDNALLISLYSKAFSFTQDPNYRKLAITSLNFVFRELEGRQGQFYSSLNADSEGKEGKYYTWTQEELLSVLEDPLLQDLALDHFGISKEGNWEDGLNILRIEKGIPELAEGSGLDPFSADSLVKEIKSRLILYREKRKKPTIDNKVITSWNAMMLTALCDAYEAFGDEEFRNKALRTGKFLEDNALIKGELFRSRGSQSSIPAFLDDYAFFIQALIRLYEITFDEKWLELSSRIARTGLKEFNIQGSPLLSYSGGFSEVHLPHLLTIEDNVIPSANSVWAECLFKLGHYYYREEWIRLSSEMCQAVVDKIAESPHLSNYANWMRVILLHQRQTYEVAIVGPEAEPFRRRLSASYLPDVIMLGGKEEGTLPLLKNKGVPGETVVYVCVEKVCKLPVRDIGQALSQMRR